MLVIEEAVDGGDDVDDDDEKRKIGEGDMLVMMMIR